MSAQFLEARTEARDAKYRPEEAASVHRMSELRVWCGRDQASSWGGALRAKTGLLGYPDNDVADQLRRVVPADLARTTGQSVASRRCVAAVSVRARLVAVAATSLLAASCGTLDDPVKDRWESRTEFSSCGKVSLAQGEEIQKQAVPEIVCLRRALKSGESAELKVTYPTVEGDPIREYYRLTPQGRLEVYTDSTDDRYTDRKWSFAECYTPEWLAEISCNQ
ncbi:hypothetical protein ACFYWN_07110 [Streptomyces sp. NPDC002917]|uniref:hypothetical protein n=1 Tax=unclassified Streptomyces TaxID=2593676 RepID=UPI0036CBAC43